LPESSPVSLLIVDDHIENLLALEAMLAGEGYRLARAGSGEEALRRLLKEDFAVILLDVQMPGMDGFETARLIKAKERTKEIPILFISATSKEAIHQFEGYSAGAIDYLVKPVTASIVKAKIAAFVRLYRSNRELEKKRGELQKRTEELEAANRELLKVTFDLSTAEAKARMIFDTSIDGMFTFDKDGTVLSVNPAMERLFGYAAADLVGTKATGVLPGLDEMRRTVPDAGEGHDVRYLTGLVSETVAVCRNGTAFEAEIQLGESVINAERVFACTVRNINERKGTLRQLTEAKNAAERASRAKSDFLATISHEIRTPLNGVIGLSDLLQDFAVPEDQKWIPRAIRDNAGRLLAVMNDILEFALLESGKEEAEKLPFSVSETIGQAVAEARPAAEAKSLELGCEIDPGVPEYVVGDPAKFRQVIDRLLDNAVKFTERGRIEAAVRVGNPERGASETVRLIASVQDTGIGIADDQKDRLFQPFSQLDSSTARKFEGMGMGLAICQAMAKAMGGEIRLESTGGPGSRFVCDIAVEPFVPSPEFSFTALSVPLEPDSEPENAASRL